MPQFDLNRITQEEKDRLLMELLSRYENDVSTQGLQGAAMSGDHPDKAADLEMLEPFAKVLDIVISKLEELEERIQANEKLVVDELFGGIEKLYKQNMRTKGIEGLKGKYGSMFEPHMEALKELAPNEDLYEALHDMLDQVRGQEGFDEEGTVKSVAEGIAQKIAKVRGIPADGVQVEVQKVEAMPGDEIKPGNDDFLQKVQRMKDDAKKKGF